MAQETDPILVKMNEIEKLEYVKKKLASIAGTETQTAKVDAQILKKLKEIATTMGAV